MLAMNCATFEEALERDNNLRLIYRACGEKSARFKYEQQLRIKKELLKQRGAANNRVNSKPKKTTVVFQSNDIKDQSQDDDNVINIFPFLDDEVSASIMNNSSNLDGIYDTIKQVADADNSDKKKKKKKDSKDGQKKQSMKQKKVSQAKRNEELKRQRQYEIDRTNASKRLVELLVQKEYITANIGRLDCTKRKDAKKMAAYNIQLQEIDNLIDQLHEKFELQTGNIQRGSKFRRTVTKVKNFFSGVGRRIKRFFHRHEEFFTAATQVAVPVILASSITIISGLFNGDSESTTTKVA